MITALYDAQHQPQPATPPNPGHTTLAALAVPGFDAVRQAQDKAAASELLAELGLPQPPTVLVHDERELLAQAGMLPGYVKLPVATSSRGVWAVEDPADLARVAAEPAVRNAFAARGRIVVQRAVPGPLVQVQALFVHGELVGAHTLVRRREGVQGSASSKESVTIPGVAEHLTTLGAKLAWHGPLSIDAILTGDTVAYIDINPRLVEPVNAELAGADLVRRWLAVSRGQRVGPPPQARSGVRTHALLMAVIRHAELGHGRRDILKELAAAALRRSWYAGSEEELLPLRSDPGGAIPSRSSVPSCWCRHGCGSAWQAPACPPTPSPRRAGNNSPDTREPPM